MRSRFFLTKAIFRSRLMNAKPLFSLVLLVGASLCFAGGKYWNVDKGGTTMKFLSLATSPRSAALAGAGVATPQSFAEITRNPLATTSQKSSQLGISHVLFSDNVDAKLTSVYFGHSFSYVNASAALEYLGYGDIEGRDDEGFKLEDYGAMAWAAQLGVGSNPSIFNWALTARFASQTIDNSTAIAVLADGGASLRLNRYFAFGATVTNFGWVSDYESEEESAPMALQAGISGTHPILDIFDLALHADAYRRADYDAEWRFGSELIYKKSLFFRVGYAYKPNDDNGVSAGLGIVFGRFQFDYAYQSNPVLDGNHLFHLGIGF